MRYFSGFSFGIGLLIGGVVVWAAGKAGSGSSAESQAPLPRVTGTAAKAVQTSQNTTASELFPTGPLSDQAFWSALRQGGPARAAALRGKVTEILASPLLYSRRRWFAAMLENYQPGDLVAIHDGMIAQEKIGGRFNKEYEQMMERAAEVEGKVVLDMVKRESGKNGAETHDWQGRCMADWSAADKAGAVAWWNSLPDGSLRDFLAGSLIEGIASKSPQEAWTAAMMFDPSQRAGVAATMVKAFAMERGLDGSVAWVASLGPEDAASKSAALTELADYMHNIDFARQSQLVEQFATEAWAGNCPAFRRIARNWAGNNGEAAAEWAGSLPDAPRQQALPEVIKKWASRETEKAGAWIETQQGSEDFQNLSAVFLQQLQNQQSPDFDAWNSKLSNLAPPPANGRR